MMNIISFGLIGEKYVNPVAQGELSTISYICWLVGHVFFDIKFWTTFSILFGYGIALGRNRARKRGVPSTGLHYRRMFWLLLIGLLHAHLIWHGDILVTYALCGMILYWVVDWKPGWLIAIGIRFLLVGTSINLGLGLGLPAVAPEVTEQMAAEWIPSQELVERELAIFRGSWATHFQERSSRAIIFETILFALLFFWRSGGLILIGMGLYQYGVVEGQRSDVFYLRGTLFGLLTGFPLVLLGVYLNEANDWSHAYSMFFGGIPNYWGGLGVSLGYICLLNLVVKRNWIPIATVGLASVGRMALTNYLMQSVVCAFLFYGHGLGWFGHLSRFELLTVVLAVWCFQLILSPLWLGVFQFGPFEWVWRSLSYWRMQPIWRKRGLPEIRGQ